MAKLFSAGVAVAVRLPMFKPPLQALAYIEDFSGVKLQMAIFAGANWNSQGYQEGRRHAPLIFLKVVSNTADSAMKMMTVIMMARPLVDDACAAGTGVFRCCGSS